MLKAFRLAVFCFLLSAITFVWAQRIPIEAYFTLDQAAAFLLADPEVGKVLRVSHAQETILRRRRQQHQDATNDFFSQPTGTARGIQAIDIKFANDCLKSINAWQRFRLRQIAVQELGPIALGRKDVARWVSLTEQQRRKFSALQDTFRDQGMLSSTELAQALNSVPPSTTIAGQEEVRHKRTMLTERFEIGRIRRQHNLESELIRLAQTLTKRQQKRWRLLKGRVFTRKSGG